MRLTIIAEGDYSYPLPPELMESLSATIRQHMAAYGLKEIEVKSKSRSSILPARISDTVLPASNK